MPLNFSWHNTAAYGEALNNYLSMMAAEWLCCLHSTSEIRYVSQIALDNYSTFVCFTKEILDTVDPVTNDLASARPKTVVGNRKSLVIGMGFDVEFASAAAGSMSG